MKKFVNDVEDILTESLRGFAAAHPDLVEIHFSPTFVTRVRGPAAGGPAQRAASGADGSVSHGSASCVE